MLQKLSENPCKVATREGAEGQILPIVLGTAQSTPKNYTETPLKVLGIKRTQKLSSSVHAQYRFGSERRGVL